jgi:hypothetical protein
MTRKNKAYKAEHKLDSNVIYYLEAITCNFRDRDKNIHIHHIFIYLSIDRLHI